ncbi:nucleotidyltransferase family protein [Frigidibacter sp. ROC022]|uniref:nucleotidyltransferase family protein n=1 Tax=Frigidibacter sp. ROC022 TaxID=2971796 RepID=UPI00215A932E|nr:nucleotidyltransferase family protein [Frigidibacter sp. ROC022]MCR8725697.1 nucleotidyltransferase family protein [Frigidibacter sp. ROC022]
MCDLVLLLLAAGQSRRMRGEDKLLQEVEAMPLLRRQALAALDTGVPVLVALPPGGSELAARRRAALDGLEITEVAVADADKGMGHSLAAAARAAPEGAGLIVLNADMPGIGATELQALITARGTAPERIWRGADSAGRAGHPVLFPARLRPELAGLTGDRGAKALIAREGAILVPLPGDAATLDLDTPEDWAAFRARGTG